MLVMSWVDGILGIENHLQEKEKIIFRWFAGCSVSKLSIVPEQEILPLNLKLKEKS